MFPACLGAFLCAVSAVPGAAASTQQWPASARHGVDAVRTFNRYELKYIAGRKLVTAFRDGLDSRLDRDPHGVRGFYPVWSRYYDTRDLRLYWEKIDGIRFRRKLRIRHYGAPDLVTDATQVWVEIKQRVNRVTQKRRVRLAYAEALGLCDGMEPAVYEPRDRAVIEEVLVFVQQHALRPTTVVGYVREAYVGREEDGGLRITVDSRVRGRDRDLDLYSGGENRHIIRPELSVVEIKVNERVPYWLTERIAGHNLQLVRMSKYCQSVEAFGRRPRSAMHVTSDAA
jgi:hypothetical protein